MPCWSNWSSSAWWLRGIRINYPVGIIGTGTPKKGGDPFTGHLRSGRPACGRLVRDTLEPSMGARRPPSMAPDGPETILPQRATQRRASSEGVALNGYLGRTAPKNKRLPIGRYVVYRDLQVTHGGLLAVDATCIIVATASALINKTTRCWGGLVLQRAA